MDERVLLVLVFLWSAGFQAENATSTESYDIRLVGGASRCAGNLEVKLQDEIWRPVDGFYWNLRSANRTCADLDCGSAVSIRIRDEGSDRDVWRIRPECDESSLKNCFRSQTMKSSSSLELNCSDSVRLVHGSSLCSGRLEVRYNKSWSSVCEGHLDLDDAQVVCRELGCGAPSFLQGALYKKGEAPLRKTFQCQGNESALLDCGSSVSNNCSSGKAVELACSDLDDVRLVGGARQCEGRIQVKRHGHWGDVGIIQNLTDWASKAEALICEQLNCGSPVTMVGNRPDGSSPVWRISSSCLESRVLLRDCVEATDYPGLHTVDLVCSGLQIENKNSSAESYGIRLVGGATSCAGDLEMKQQNEDWKPVDGFYWSLWLANRVCAELDCGSAVSVRFREKPSVRDAWIIRPDCGGSSLKNCFSSISFHSSFVEMKCLDAVRLVRGSGLCSGRLEVRSNQSWSSVCEGHLDLHDAKVVCRELGCGAPLLHQGVLYGKGGAPVRTSEFQCEGHESALLDCESSVSETCSSGKAVELNCSVPDYVRLVGGASRCEGTLEVKQHEEWHEVVGIVWTLKAAAVLCNLLDCGPPVSVRRKQDPSEDLCWIIPSCVEVTSSLRDCVTTCDAFGDHRLGLTCADSVRLVQGSSLCSGRLEVRSNQSWSSVCEDDLDHNDTEVICRELGCGAPSLLQGALYGEGEAPVWTSEFQCDGNESALLDCRRSHSTGKTCSTGKAAELTCRHPGGVRLVGQPSLCAGSVEIQHNDEWRPLGDWHGQWDLDSGSAVCRHLDCGSAVSLKIQNYSSSRPVWFVSPSCMKLMSGFKDCLELTDLSNDKSGLEVVCSDLLSQPVISLSTSTDGLYEDYQQGFRLLMGSDFTITCSIQPQYSGGSFQLISNTKQPQNRTLPAVNHSAHFLFSSAGYAHRGDHTCVYHVDAFNHSFSSPQSPVLYLTVGVSMAHLILRVLVFIPSLVAFDVFLFFYYKNAVRRIRLEARIRSNPRPGPSNLT